MAGIASGAEGGRRQVDAPIEGLAEHCTAEPAYLRDHVGDREEADDTDASVERAAMRASERSVVVLHLVAHSRTGLRSPCVDVCALLKKRLGDRLLVLVDAAQGRLAPRDVRRALDLDFVVLFTGSKLCQAQVSRQPTRCPWTSG